jgi:hypothetical protein
MRVLCIGLLVSLLASPALADVLVAFDGVPSQVAPDSFFDVFVVADITQPEAIIGWGLDVLTAGALTYVPPPVEIGPQFDPAYAPDGDGLAGLVPPPGTVWGTDIELAKITLHAGNGPGWAALGVGMTDGDLTEGFMTESGFIPGSDLTLPYFDPENPQGSGFPIYITPEPASLLLLALVGLFRRR